MGSAELGYSPGACLQVSVMPPVKISITYPDSFTAMALGTSPGPGDQPRPCHGRVFLLGELPGLVERFGIPDPHWDGHYQSWATWPAEAYIEVQLWSDDPIRGFITSD